ncbi:MAG TPA: imidazole glycerol phosphate synthase subunit HisH [Solirubrobacteraceae bacterium]|jgi:glutamine amidotransferase|nr:imidazole glycerol phosphate synthase subunit HisH [Solirubrobacteraceae bacterium]
MSGAGASAPPATAAPREATAVEIGIVDYGMGNRRSVEKALAHVGARPLLSSDPDRLAAAPGLVLPGVGAFPKAMENLRRLGLDRLLAERLRAGTPVFGICLGMQLAFDSSEELGGAEGLSFLPGAVRPLRAGSLKLPHIGWNEVVLSRPDSPLLSGLPDRCAFYHVHSLAPVPADPADVIGTAEYGSPFVTAVQRGSFYGVQFHPEKSSAAGLRMLANFAALCGAVAPAPPASRP